jgi:hypothetical protein
MSTKLSAAIASAALLSLGSGVALAQPQADMTPARRGEGGMRATQALNMLEVAGDGQYSNFRANGRDFTADVVRNGQPLRVQVDPDAGTITALPTAAQVTAAPAPQASNPDDRRPVDMKRLPGGYY